MGNCAKGLGHRPGVDHCQHRDVEAAGDVGGGGCAVKQTHDAFDDDQIRVGCSAGESPACIFFAAHAEVEVLAGAATGDRVDLWVKKVWAAFENGHPATLPGVQTGQGGGNGSFALSGGGGGNEYGGAVGHGFQFWCFACGQDDNSFWSFLALTNCRANRC